MQTLVKTLPTVKIRPQTKYIRDYASKHAQESANQPVCPCCSSPLLRHVRRSGIYWRCSHCHQEMPVLSTLHPMTHYI